MADFRLWVVVLSDSAGPVCAARGSECFGVYESPNEALDAARAFESDSRYCTVLEIKPLPEARNGG